jgi:hypothetical protein
MDSNQQPVKREGKEPQTVDHQIKNTRDLFGQEGANGDA